MPEETGFMLETSVNGRGGPQWRRLIWISVFAGTVGLWLVQMILLARSLHEDVTCISDLAAADDFAHYYCSK